MADIGENIKTFMKKGLEAIESTANSIAETTRQKVDEINLQNRKNEVMCGLSQKLYDLWLQGEKLPESLIPDLEEIVRLDEEIRLSKKETEAENEKQGIDEPDFIAEKVTEKKEDVIPDIPVIEVNTQDESEPNEKEEEADPCPFSSAIDDLFKGSDKMDHMAEKVNSSLDEMGENLRKFTQNFGKELSDMADELMGKKNKDE